MLALIKRLLNHLVKPNEVERGIDKTIKRGVEVEGAKKSNETPDLTQRCINESEREYRLLKGLYKELAQSKFSPVHDRIERELNRLMSMGDNKPRWTNKGGVWREVCDDCKGKGMYWTIDICIVSPVKGESLALPTRAMACKKCNMTGVI